MTSPSVWKIVWVSMVARLVVALILLLGGLGFTYVTLGKEKFWQMWEEEKRKHGLG